MEDELVEHRTAKPVSQPDAPTTRPTPCKSMFLKVGNIAPLWAKEEHQGVKSEKGAKEWQ